MQITQFVKRKHLLCEKNYMRKELIYFTVSLSCVILLFFIIANLIIFFYKNLSQWMKSKGNIFWFCHTNVNHIPYYVINLLNS